MELFPGIALSIMCLIYFGAVSREIIKNGQVYDLLAACCYMAALEDLHKELKKSFEDHINEINKRFIEFGLNVHCEKDENGEWIFHNYEKTVYSLTINQNDI